MDIRHISGYYTYRSFLNNPLPVDDFNRIKFAEAELFLNVQLNGRMTGILSFPAKIGHPEKLLIDISGEIKILKDKLSFEFIAKGRQNTDIFDWEYAYNGSASFLWKDGNEKQRLSLTGTVLRVKDHGLGEHIAKAGETASFIAVQRDFIEPKNIPEIAILPSALKMVSSRSHRLIHALWHLLRGVVESPEGSNNFVLTWYLVTKDEESKEKVRELGWYLSRPPFTEQRALDLTNGAGEDFLYMHRKMIAMIRKEYESKGIPYIQSWKTSSTTSLPLPESNIPQFVYSEKDDPSNSGKKIFVIDHLESGNMIPIPPPDPNDENDNTIDFRKSSEFFSNVMRRLAEISTNPRYLATLSLGALGNLIEFTIHNWMHIRWANPSGGFLRDPKTEELIKDSNGDLIVRNAFDLDSRWDHPIYDYLGDTYSSHVNPLFWRLHGWVDDRIEDWFNAHNAAHPGEIERYELNDVAWFKKGKWVEVDDPFYWPEGDHHPHAHHNHDQKIIENIEKIIDIITTLANNEASVEGASLNVGKRILMPGGAMNFIHTTDIDK